MWLVGHFKFRMWLTSQFCETTSPQAVPGVVSGQVASASPERNIMLKLHPRHIESESLGIGPSHAAICVLINPPEDSDPD